MQNVTTIALSRMLAQQRAMDVTASNLANANTMGYKAERVVFSDWISKQPNTQGSAGNIAYTQDRATYRDQQTGSLTHTGNPLDVAIGADGFLTVATPQGPRLTRSGHFDISPAGTVVDSSGNNLLDNAGQPLRIAPTDTRIMISGDGSIDSENGPLGRIGVVSVQDPLQVQAEGDHLLRANTPTQPLPTPHLVQGALEESNVSPILEVNNMTSQLREFEFVSQLVQAESDRVQSTIDKLGQPQN